MKKSSSIFLLLSAPLLLVAVAWQAGRFSSLAAEARALELEQEAWVEENEKLVGGIAVLESRERSAQLAEELGLEKASPDRRLFVSTKPPASAGGSAAPAARPRAAPGGSPVGAPDAAASERSDG